MGGGGRTVAGQVVDDVVDGGGCAGFSVKASLIDVAEGVRG